jgi:hypothetical protein
MNKDKLGLWNVKYFFFIFVIFCFCTLGTFFKCEILRCWKKWQLEDWNCVKSVSIIFSELCTGFCFVCNEGKVNPFFVTLSFFCHHTVCSSFCCLYDLKNSMIGERGQSVL